LKVKPSGSVRIFTQPGVVNQKCRYFSSPALRSIVCTPPHIKE
jgi:hypothetical protein